MVNDSVGYSNTTRFDKLVRSSCPPSLSLTTQARPSPDERPCHGHSRTLLLHSTPHLVAHAEDVVHVLHEREGSQHLLLDLIIPAEDVRIVLAKPSNSREPRQRAAQLQVRGRVRKQWRGPSHVLENR